MKKVFSAFILIFSIASINYSQVGYVEVENEIYDFLRRMNTLNIIENYDPFELPKTRIEIKEYLKQVIDKSEYLDAVDNNKVNDFLVEFEYELNLETKYSSSLFPDIHFLSLFQEKEKYLYSYQDSQVNSLFINFIGKLDYLGLSDDQSSESSFLYRFGGQIRGTLLNYFGFSINSTNGSFFGSKSLARNFSSLKYNYKFHREDEDNSGNDYFDETSAFATYQNEYLSLKIGNDRKFLGYGPHKVLLSDNAPRMDYLSLDANYKSLSFSYFHGKLLGNLNTLDYGESGNVNIVEDKYFVYHRLGIELSNNSKIGIGEMLIYANRNIDFAYANPFNFYKSAEHANQDRDNSFLFIDFQLSEINNLSLYSTFLIDDSDFGKIGTGWYGNKTLLSVGAYSSQLYGIIPIDFEVQYIRIDPYVFAHRMSENNFTNLGYNLGTSLQPNSSSTKFYLYYRPHHRINISSIFSYTLHGANIIDENGNVSVNYGGDINLGHRVSDSEEVYFLQGKREIFREYNINLTFEPINNWKFVLSLNYLNSSNAYSENTEQFFTTFSLFTKL